MFHQAGHNGGNRQACGFAAALFRFAAVGQKLAQHATQLALQQITQVNRH